MDGAGRVAVVTGGSRGIGRGIVLALAAAGHHGVVNYRSDAEAAEDVPRARELGAPEALAIQADVSDPEEGSADRGVDGGQRADRTLGEQRRRRARTSPRPAGDDARRVGTGC